MTMMTRSLWWLKIQFRWFTDNNPTAYQCTWRSMIADARIAPMTMWSFYADNSDDNDLIVRENYSKFYDVVAKLQQGREFWEEWVSQSKCLNWSFRPDLNVPPSKRLPKIAPDLQAHNFGALSDGMDVLGKMFSNLNIHKKFCVFCATWNIELPGSE